MLPLGPFETVIIFPTHVDIQTFRTEALAFEYLQFVAAEYPEVTRLDYHNTKTNERRSFRR